VTRPTVAQAEAWQPDSLRRLADAWEEAARRLTAHVDSAEREIHRSNEFWTGATADGARDGARGISAAGDDAARRLVLASVAARDGADQMASARATVLSRVTEARDDGFDVADDGTVSIRAGPSPLLVALSGGDPVVAHDMLTMGPATLPIRSSTRWTDSPPRTPTRPMTSRRRSRRRRSLRPPRLFRPARGRFRLLTWWRVGRR